MTYEERIARIERKLTGKVSWEGTVAERTERVENLLIQRYLAQSWRMGQTDIANMLARIESDPELRSQILALALEPAP